MSDCSPPSRQHGKEEQSRDPQGRLVSAAEGRASSPRAAEQINPVLT